MTNSTHLGCLPYQAPDPTNQLFSKVLQNLLCVCTVFVLGPSRNQVISTCGMLENKSAATYGIQD